MGRSMRKFKKGKSKVRVGLLKKRKPFKPDPVVIPATKEKIEWNPKSTVEENFKSTGFLLNPNRLTVSNEPMDEPDDVRSALGKKRTDGKHAPLQRLSAMQRIYMGRIIEKYKDNFEAMSKDMKLNQMQHSSGALKKLCARFHAYETLSSDPKMDVD